MRSAAFGLTSTPAQAMYSSTAYAPLGNSMRCPGSYKRPAREDVISVLESYPDPSAQLIVECYKPLYDVAIDY